MNRLILRFFLWLLRSSDSLWRLEARLRGGERDPLRPHMQKMRQEIIAQARFAGLDVTGILRR